MKVIIAGSRTMCDEDYPLIQKAVIASGFDVTEVVCGCAPGADTYGGQWAREHDIPITPFPADWVKYGKYKAGFIRNAQMAEYADALIVLIWRNSGGSTDMLKRMNKLRKVCYTVYDGVIGNSLWS